MTRMFPVMITAVYILFTSPSHVSGQVRASERGTVSQTIDGTTLTIDYSRPVARGRDSLFGGVVHWGMVWTPGANWATTLETDKPFRLNGQNVAAGKYGIWMIPRADSAWTVLLMTDARRFHVQRPDPADAAVSFTVEPQTGPHMETLMWYFPVVAPDGATLRMHWGQTFVPLRITVEPSKTWTVDEEDAQPLLGVYTFTSEPDSTGRQTSGPIDVTIHHLEGRLVMQWGDSPVDLESGTALLPAREGSYYPAMFRDGELFDVHAETVVVFQVEGDRAAGFEMRSDGEVVGRATRIH